MNIWPIFLGNKKINIFLFITQVEIMNWVMNKFMTKVMIYNLDYL